MAADLTSWELMEKNEVGYLMEHENWDDAYEFFLRRRECYAGYQVSRFLRIIIDKVGPFHVFKTLVDKYPVVLFRFGGVEDMHLLDAMIHKTKEDDSILKHLRYALSLDLVRRKIVIPKWSTVVRAVYFHGSFDCFKMICELKSTPSPLSEEFGPSYVKDIMCKDEYWGRRYFDLIYDMFFMADPDEYADVIYLSLIMAIDFGL